MRTHITLIAASLAVALSGPAFGMGNDSSAPPAAKPAADPTFGRAKAMIEAMIRGDGRETRFELADGRAADQREFDPHEEAACEQIIELLRLEDVGAMAGERGRHRGDDAGVIETG